MDIPPVAGLAKDMRYDGFLLVRAAEQRAAEDILVEGFGILRPADDRRITQVLHMSAVAEQLVERGAVGGGGRL